MAVGLPIATAGDSPALIFTDPEESTAHPGETVAVDVLISSDGATPHDSVESIELVATFDTEVVSVEDVEAANWFGDSHAEAVETDVTVDETGGNVTVSLEHTEEGVGANRFGERVATITFEVLDEPTSDAATVDFTHSHIVGTQSYPVPVITEAATLSVDEGESAWLRAATHPLVLGGSAVLLIGVVAGVWFYTRDV